MNWNSRVGNFTYDQAVIELGPPDKQAKLSDNTVVAEWIKRRSGSGFSIGLGTGLHADFGSGLWDGGPIGIPYTTVPGTQPKVNVTFTESRTNPQVRIARVPDDGYWSYVGTDILSIPADEPTMNLEGFTM